MLCPCYYSKKWKETKSKIIEDVKALMSTNEHTERRACEIIAQKYKQNTNTVRSLYRRSLKPKEKLHGNCLLTAEEEYILVGVLRGFSTCSLPKSRQDTIDIVRRWKNLGEKWKGGSWFDKFVLRHSDVIKYTKAKTIDTKRVKSSSLEDVKEFVRELEAIEEKYNIKDDFFINADETAAAPGPQHIPKTVNTTSRRASTLVTPEVDSLRTILPFVAASGKVWLLVLIFQKVHESESTVGKKIYFNPNRKKTRGSFPIFYASTETGYISKELWEQAIQALLHELDPHLGDLPALLLIDRHTSHLSVEAMTALVRRGVNTLYFPPHMTHVLQPLDDTPFSVLKKEIAAEKIRLTSQLVAQQLRPTHVLQRVVPQAFVRSFTPDNIKAGFKNTGLRKFDKEKILERSKKAIAQFENLDDCPEPDSVIAKAEKVVKLALTGNKTEVDLPSGKLPAKGKLYTAEDILSHKSKTENLANPKNNKKGQTDKKKRKRESNVNQEESPKKRSKKSKKASPDDNDDFECSICNEYIDSADDFFSCSMCGNYKLCSLHSVDIAAIEMHIDRCSKKAPK